MRKVDLNMSEQFKYEVIKDCYDGKLNKKYCEVKLNITRRSVNRLLLQYQSCEKAGFIHGNLDRVPATKKPAQLSNDILFLYLNKYRDTNFSHFTELLAER